MPSLFLEASPFIKVFIEMRESLFLFINQLYCSTHFFSQHFTSYNHSIYWLFELSPTHSSLVMPNFIHTLYVSIWIKFLLSILTIVGMIESMSLLKYIRRLSQPESILYSFSSGSHRVNFIGSLFPLNNEQMKLTGVVNWKK